MPMSKSKVLIAPRPNVGYKFNVLPQQFTTPTILLKHKANIYFLYGVLYIGACLWSCFLIKNTNTRRDAQQRL